MIPRPHKEWVRNEQESKLAKERLTASLSELKQNPSLKPSLSGHVEDDTSVGHEEGVEVTDVYDVEARFLDRSSSINVARGRRDSLQGDWGVEVADINDEEAQFVRRSWKGSSLDVASSELLGLSDSEGEDESTGAGEETAHLPTAGAESEETVKATGMSDVLCRSSGYRSESNEHLGAPRGSKSNGDTAEKWQAPREESSRELGVETVDLYKDEAAFVQRSWRSTVPGAEDVLSETALSHEDEIKACSGDLNTSQQRNPEGKQRDTAVAAEGTSKAFIATADRPLRRSQSADEATCKPEDPVETVSSVGSFSPRRDGAHERGQSKLSLCDERTRELGVEAVNLYEDEAAFVQNSWRSSISSSHGEIPHVPQDGVGKVVTMEAMAGASLRELGVEAVEYFESDNEDGSLRK